MRYQAIYFITLFGMAFYSMVDTASAQIRIAKPAGEKIGVSLNGLSVEPGPAADLFIATLRDNIERSGWLTVTGSGRADVAVSGSVNQRRNDVRAEIRAVGVHNQQNYLRQAYRHPADDVRRLAHQVVDDLVYAVTGHRGIATTRIIFVGQEGRNRELFMMDADGGNFEQWTRDGSVSVRPRWGPTPDKVTYTSYINHFPDVFLIDLRSGNRTAVAEYSGLNSGGVLSPSGNEMAVILSKDGNPELYVKDLKSGRLTRLTHTLQANEASPSWSPDGRHIVYVSDQAGPPHLYIISRQGGPPRRLTTRGNENVAPDWGPNGLIAFASRVGRQYHLVVMDPEGNEVYRFSDRGDASYEDPSWAPNGRHIVLGRRENFRSQIYIIDTLGDPPVRLTPSEGEWLSPAWSPHQP